MVFFFHHYELPAILQQIHIQHILSRARPHGHDGIAEAIGEILEDDEAALLAANNGNLAAAQMHAEGTETVGQANGTAPSDHSQPAHGNAQGETSEGRDNPEASTGQGHAGSGVTGSANQSQQASGQNNPVNNRNIFSARNVLRYMLLRFQRQDGRQPPIMETSLNSHHSQQVASDTSARQRDSASASRDADAAVDSITTEGVHSETDSERPITNDQQRNESLATEGTPL